MGVIASCCRDGDADENEALLAGQNGHGADNNEGYSTAQMREDEERLRARENMLKEIVANTNDKLIDISMISNSGIVIEGTDSKPSDGERLNGRSSGPIAEDGNSLHSEEVQTPRAESKFVALNTDTAMSDEMKKQLKLLHEAIFRTLDEQLTVEPTGKLTATLK